MRGFLCSIDELDKHIGYYLSNEVLDPETGRVLLTVNCEVKERIINALKMRGIDSIYISKEKIGDGEVDEESGIQKGIIEIRQTKKQLVGVFNDISASVISSRGLGREMLERVEDVVSRMIEVVSKNPTTSLYLGAMNDEDQYILKHSVNVSFLALCMAFSGRRFREILRDREKGLGRFSVNQSRVCDDMVPLGVSCLLHDIGKVLLIEVINANRKYMSDDKVWERIKAHPKVGYDILFGKSVDSHSLLGVKYHHENFDGSGYPYGVSGYKIHVFARLIRVIDSYDAAISADRPGKVPKKPEEVMKELKALAGTVYDKDIVSCFLEFLGG
jgi:HD-GYP domain-containing protein (c-di-GMP phosphodiesterase class II)